jgi:hypothetical protein
MVNVRENFTASLAWGLLWTDVMDVTPDRCGKSGLGDAGLAGSMSIVSALATCWAVMLAGMAMLSTRSTDTADEHVRAS